jgi:hypothetical protein
MTLIPVIMLSPSCFVNPLKSTTVATDSISGFLPSGISLIVEMVKGITPCVCVSELSAIGLISGSFFPDIAVLRAKISCSRLALRSLSIFICARIVS